MKILQRSLYHDREARETERLWKTRHRTPGFMHSKASPGLRTSAECGKRFKFFVRQPKSRTNAFAIGLYPVSSRAFSG